MTFRRFALLLAGLGALAFSRAQTVPVIPYDSTMAERASIDGTIDNEEGNEYPATYADKASGLTANWGFDDSLLYVGLQTRGRGWLAIGFGSPTMNKSNMIIGYYTEDSTEVMNQIGAGYKHTKAPLSDSAILEAEIDFDEETGVTTMEFVYPLRFSAGEGEAPAPVPGGPCEVILAQNTKDISLTAKHTNRSAFKVKLAEIPPPPKPETQPEAPSEPQPKPKQ